jgi:diguanylate cyclase (GGDEF)-like protein/PAS domain S-box-containing protein
MADGPPGGRKDMGGESLTVRANNRRRAFEIRAHGRDLVFPYGRLEPSPTDGDRVVEARPGDSAFYYRLASGLEGTVTLERVRDYEEGPARRTGELLEKLTEEARKAVAESALSKREISRLLETSTSQLYRLLDPAYRGKSAGQMLALLHALGREVRLEIDPGRDRGVRSKETEPADESPGRAASPSHAEAALRESEERYHHLFSRSREPLYVSRPDGSFVDLNQAALDLLGYARAEMGQLIADQIYVDEADRRRFQKAIEATGFVRDYEIRLKRKGGEILECRLTATLRRNPDGSIREYQGILHDVTREKRAAEALRASEERFRSLIENAMDTITILGRDGTILYESPSIERVLGYLPEDLVGKNVFAFVHPDDQGRLVKEFQRITADPGRRTQAELRVLHADGSWRILECIAQNLLDDPAILGVVVNARDVTPRKEAEGRLLHDAFHDKLTGLPNRALLLDRLKQLLRRSRRPDHPGFAVLSLDLDRFKVVNDSLGHTIGDDLLIRIARRLEASLRPGDTVARLGGDEFTILVDGGKGPAHVTRVVERIQGELQAPFRLRERDVYVNVSIGIAVSTTGYDSAEEMLRDADTALNRAKASGPARHALFDKEMHAEAVRTLDLEVALRRALERDEFGLEYQPIVGLESRQVEGFEALIRWNHPERGRLLPGEFLKLAEETGLIVSMGRLVFKRSMEQFRIWSAAAPAGRELGLNLNVSAKELTQPDMVKHLDDLILRTEVTPARITLELTESALMEQADLTMATLQELKELGVRLAVDDFGTGYSSLSYLHNFPIDVVKIDQSFVRRIGEPEGSPGLVRAITALGLDLGLRVVAEGVETDHQREVLRDLGCHAGQGSLFLEPTSPDRAGRIIERAFGQGPGLGKSS